MQAHTPNQRYFLDDITPWAELLAGGAVFVLLFTLHYALIPSFFYQMRDDGVITLSHARNWVEYGFIGVNPSGERMEGFSAPVQFFLFTLLYSLTGAGYAAYMQLQTFVCTFLLGCIFMAFFEGALGARLLATALGGALLAFHARFIEWHGSGMENALTHMLFLGTLLVLYQSAKRGSIRMRWSLIPLLASVSRLDSIYHILPLLMLFSLYWYIIPRSGRGLGFSLLVLMGWALFQCWRYCYFGSLIPNTALAEGIDLSARLQHWRFSLQDALRIAPIFFRQYGLYLLPCLLLVIFSGYPKKDPPFYLLTALIATACLATFLHPFFFGPARLDSMRTNSHLLIDMVLILTLFLRRAGGMLLYGSLGLLIMTLGIGCISGLEKPQKIAWQTEEFASTLIKFRNLAQQENLPRPTVANPDLGLLSWQKEFNIIDLGKIGSPILVRLHSPNVIANYVFEFAAPDFIESHDIWSCNFDFIFNDARFGKLYQPVQQTIYPEGCNGHSQYIGVWQRKAIAAHATTSERQLIDRLAQNLSVEILAQAWSQCKEADPQNACAYVARTAYRFLPEFRQSGQVGALKAIFPNPGFSHYLITGSENPLAYQDALAEIRQYTREHPQH